MRLSSFLPAFTAITCGALLSVGAARVGADIIQKTSKDAVEKQLTLEGFEWASVTSDGLQIVLEGTAPNEIEQLSAQRAAGRVVDPSRVINVMNIVKEESIAAPDFSIEILRNDNGISLIGLVPTRWDKENFVKELKSESRSGNVADLLEQADYPIPDNWETATAFGIEAIGMLPRSKISLSADQLRINGLADTKAQKAFLETALARSEPQDLDVLIDIAAPRPVISPFTVRFLKTEDSVRFDACAAETPQGHARIMATARALGMTDPECTIGLGAPSARWANAVEETMRALAELGAGSVTLSDTEVTLIGVEGQNKTTFDQLVSELDAALPGEFTLHASLPATQENDASDEAAQFIAIRSPEGQVQIRGKLQDERSQMAAEAVAKANFGASSVYLATGVDPDLPAGWSERVLATIDALSNLAHGSATMTQDNVIVTGETGNQNARAEISRLLADKLGNGQQFSINVTYQRKLDPVIDIPSPQECVARANNVVAEEKIVFAPGSTDVDETSFKTLDRLAEVMKNCEETEMEIGGHTDSQGGEDMNLNLSQARANSVLDALLARRVAGVKFSAQGYGEAIPVADNETDAGREANRRIEFKLLGLDEAAEKPKEEDSGQTAKTEASE